MSDASKESTQGRFEDMPAQSQRHDISDEEMFMRLSDELDDMLMNAEEEDVDADKLDAILAALDELDPLPEVEAFDTEASLQRFHKRLAERSIEDAPAEQTSSNSSPKRARRAIPRILLVAALLALILAMPVQGSQQSLFEVFVQWTAGILHISSDDEVMAQLTKHPLAEGETRTFDSVEEMREAFGVVGPVLPTWVPERMGTPEVWAQRTSGVTYLYMSYESNSDHLLVKILEPLTTDGPREVETNFDAPESFVVHNTKFRLSSDVRAEKTTWESGVLICKITGTVTRDEMEQIIYSLFEENYS